MVTRNTKTSCFVFRVSCISIQTREPQVETRNKHEKLKNLHVLPDLFSIQYYPFPLAFSPLADSY